MVAWAAQVTTTAIQGDGRGAGSCITCGRTAAATAAAAAAPAAAANAILRGHRHGAGSRIRCGTDGPDCESPSLRAGALKVRRGHFETAVCRYLPQCCGMPGDLHQENDYPKIDFFFTTIYLLCVMTSIELINPLDPLDFRFHGHAATRDQFFSMDSTQFIGGFLFCGTAPYSPNG